MRTQTQRAQQADQHKPTGLRALGNLAQSDRSCATLAAAYQGISAAKNKCLNSPHTCSLPNAPKELANR